jgi:halocyanin-like protein
MYAAMTWTPRRRTFIRFGLASSAVGLAGCSGGGDDDSDPTEEESATATGTGTATGTATAGPSTETAPAPGTEPADTAEQPTPADEITPYQNPQQRLEQWLSATSNYEGNIQDRRADDQVDVQVGTESDNGNFAFDPVVIRIQTGTTVQWQWTGRGGAHNVQARRGQFRSGDPREGGGIAFQHTFEETGMYLYECSVHTNFGMRGAVIVEEPQTLSGYPKVDEWLEDYQYSGRLTDARGGVPITIQVGSDSPDGNFGFRPIAPLVDPGTEITFEWTGRGGNHQIVWEDTPVDLESSQSTSSARATYSVTLDTPGVYLYRCGDHRIFGGHGAIVVADE